MAQEQDHVTPRQPLVVGAPRFVWIAGADLARGLGGAWWFVFRAGDSGLFPDPAMLKLRPIRQSLADDSISQPSFDDDNPEWTEDDFAKARPAREVLPQFIGETATQELMRRGRGRPQKSNKKVNQTLRLDPDVLEAFRQEGSGWQAHINAVLREHMPRRGK